MGINMLGEDLEEDGRLLAVSAYRYYHQDQAKQSKLTDHEYDALKNILIINWTSLSKELKDVIGPKDWLQTSGCHIKPPQEWLDGY